MAYTARESIILYMYDQIFKRKAALKEIENHKPKENYINIYR